MDFYMRLPRNRREFAVFLLIVSLISVNLIAPVISMFELGFSLKVWHNTLRVLPFIWLAVVILVILTQKPAGKLKDLIVHPKDSFRSQITINIMCNVFLMSFFMTAIGGWIGQGAINYIPIGEFLAKWPRNFGIAFIVEAIIAQPIARYFLYRYHLTKETFE
ncbi:hypothetical protein [Ligilactobacillus apodemi]|uniref:Integral membrane protein n=1 Tax=Ligilactobacillus apodemi DSM 16634 = JCM 16172 TaxID=1423724 RepID=A0A0R1U1C0_9LACO|nr:hypothetical protein [Ligilactobacillus apodemi]KRL87117.1 hypothetical protein FC32_GL000410 [Ligilactobacillus apodemi DSM 16634 = JCM 16172]